jgi:hypothetical protein
MAIFGTITYDIFRTNLLDIKRVLHLDDGKGNW